MGGILDKVFHRKSKAYHLTDIGKKKHDQYAGGEPRLTILSYLDETGASTVKEISEGTNLNEDRVESAIKTMLSEGWLEAK